MKLVVGLGNPGKQYELTRHNVGFLCLDSLIEEMGGNFKLDSSMQSMIATMNYNGEKCLFIKPQTFMNLSGEAVVKVINYYKISIADILVVYDDMDLPLGSLRLREKGSAGSHNGMKNIVSHLHTEEFKRIRVGISGHANIDAKDYVLGQFSRDERLVLFEAISSVKEAVKDFLMNKPFLIIMGKYNSKKK